MKVKKAGFLTKIVVLALLIYLATALLNLRSQLRDYKAEEAVQAQQAQQLAQDNDRLSYAIEHKDDPDVLESVARDKGYVKAGEKLFKDIAG